MEYKDRKHIQIYNIILAFLTLKRCLIKCCIIQCTHCVFLCFWSVFDYFNVIAKSYLLFGENLLFSENWIRFVSIESQLKISLLILFVLTPELKVATIQLGAIRLQEVRRKLVKLYFILFYYTYTLLYNTCATFHLD